MKRAEQQYRSWIEQEREAHYESGQGALDYITNSTAKYHGRCVRTLYMPKMFEEKDIVAFREIIRVLYGIFDKVIEHYLADEGYRALFQFDKRLEELILLPALYASKLPVARIDIFYDEETGNFKFCEFNTDGTSAMNEDRELNRALCLTKGYEELKKHYEIETFELFDTLVQELLNIYQSSKYPVEHPHVAIVDFMDCATENEFQIIAKRFEQAGCSAQICEIRSLSFDGSALYTEDGRRIDLIYRRAVTCDIMQHYDEVQPFLQAVRAGVVCLLGDFRTQIVHNKIFYQIVQSEATMSFLNEEERLFVRAHFPYTERFEEELVPIKGVLEERERWILKPEDSYGSRGVYAGVEYEQEEWEKLVPQQYGKQYIIQEFCTPYRSVNIDLMKVKDASFGEYSNITGMYVYNGRFYGIYSRIAQCSVISTQYSEMAIPTIVIAEKR